MIVTLEVYLKELYPKNSKEWYLIRVSFLNDYHRFISQNLLVELKKVSNDECKGVNEPKI